MDKLTMMVSTTVVAVSMAMAQAPQPDAQLEKNASAAAITKALQEPDGVAIALAEDGSFQWFARGTAVSEFNNAEDILEARQAARAKAKYAFAKFLKEKIQGEDSYGEASIQAVSLSKEGNLSSKTVTKEKIKEFKTRISTYAEAVLKGAVVLREVKIPTSGGVEIQVTMGISSKTLDAVHALKDALNGTRKSCGASPSKTLDVSSQEEAEERVSNTLF